MSLDGVLILDKPAGLVSMRAVERVRRLTRTKKAGHAGTLDPAATGVLPICLGQATKIASLIVGDEKEYLATVRLGLETNTFDLDGEVVRTAEVPEVLTEATLAPHLSALTGEITQSPPIFSAIRVDGQRLYKRARRGEAVEVPTRQVVIHELELLRVASPEVELRVRCGKGTYIRSLAADLGRRLGCGAALSALRRTRVGALDLGRSLTLEALAERLEQGPLGEALLSTAEALAHLPSIRLEADDAARVRMGQPLRLDHLEGASPTSEGLLRLLDEGGALVALAERRADRLQPRRVFPEADQSR